MKNARDDIYTRVTNDIIKAIEAGVSSCRLPWHITEADCFAPINAVSKRPYRGINVLILWAAAVANGYKSGIWATYRQWNELGAQVKAGERAATVVLWKPTERIVEEATEEADSHSRRGLLARGFSVFNASQVTGFRIPTVPKLSEGERIRGAEQVLFGVGANIVHGGASAYYGIDTDTIHVPRFDSFRDAVGYYATLAHELTHWTGAKPRLNRELGTRFGSDAYAVEELIAEFGAAFLCARFNLSVEPRPDHADYIGDWLRVLKHDKKALFTAASKAQQATDWLFEHAGAVQTEASSIQAA